MHYDRYCRVGPPLPTSTSHHGTFTSTTTSSVLSRASTQPVEGEAGPEPVVREWCRLRQRLMLPRRRHQRGMVEEAMAEIGAEDMDRRGRTQDRSAGHSSMSSHTNRSSSSSDDSFDGDTTPATPPDRQKS